MATARLKLISIDDLVLDGGTQSRVGIDEYTVERYVDAFEAAESKWPFPPLVVFSDPHDEDSTLNLVSSGFHRVLAARRLGLESAPCIVKQGTAWDALLFGMSSNHKHGLPPSRADSRNSVALLLGTSQRITHKEISTIVGVTTRTVRRIASELRERTMSASGKEALSVQQNALPQSEGQEDGTDPGCQEDATLPLGGSDASGGGRSVEPKEALSVQRRKTLKTAEALMREFDDLNRLSRNNDNNDIVISKLVGLISIAKNWE